MPTNPTPENQYPTVHIPRVVELRMEMIDPDNQKVGARAVIDEQVLITAHDPREPLFYYLQKMARKMIEEAFPPIQTTPEEEKKDE